MKRVVIEYAGMSGVGNTVRAAKEDAVRRAELAISGDFCPRMIFFRGEKAVIWREPGYDGARWCYAFLSSDDSTIRDGASVNSRLLRALTSVDTLESAERRSRYHLAQNFWDGTETKSPVILNTSDQTEFSSWSGWQIRYRMWRDAGLDDARAGENASNGLSPASDYGFVNPSEQPHGCACRS